MTSYVLFGISAALESAVQAGIFEILLEGPCSASGLSERASCDPLGTQRVLDVLVGAGVLQKSDGRYWVPEPLRSQLQRGPGGYAAHRALWNNTPRFLRRGERVSSMDGASGERAAAYQAAVGGLGSLFDTAATLLAQSLPARARILDVGAGSGVWSLAMLRQHQGAKATALDFARVLPRFRERAQSLSLDARIETIDADFHDAELPRRFDRIILANVLHLEDELGASALLMRAANWLEPGGDLVIVDVLDNLDQAAAHAAYALHLAMRTKNGVPHPTAKLREWIMAAGLAPERSVDLSSELPGLGAMVASESL